MAFYKLNVKIFSRGKGSCAVRSAAYRAGERIRDERTRVMYNFASREDVAHKEIFLPTQFAGNATMDWARDRTTLWNEVESNDRRNARLAREVLVVLPAELNSTQRVQLARRFGQELASRYRVAVDATVHLPRALPASLNHHAHLLLTTRQVTPNGMGPRSILDQTGTNLRAMGLGPSKHELLLIRERWAQITNEAFREAGLDLRIDHRSLAARGISREPRVGIPHTVLCIERRTGVPSAAAAAIRNGYRERVEARAKGPDEFARVLQKQREEARQRSLEREARKAALPKKDRDAASMAEERRRRLRERYNTDAAYREKKRGYYRKNAAAILQKEREARQRAKPSPELQAAQRWLKWRQRHRELAPDPTPADSVRNWLAYRERQKQVELGGATQKPTHERTVAKSIDNDARQKKKKRTHDYGYGL